MKHFKRLFLMLLTVAFVLAPVSEAFAGMVPEKDASLAGYTVILHTNDSHGRAVPDSYNGYMGFTAVSALKKSYEAAGAQVILLDAGDTLHGLPFANLVKGESIIKIMNAAGYTAMAPGNHDFNYGTETLTELSKEMSFPLLSANITKKDNGTDLFNDHMIVEKNGVKYGIFGLSTPETATKTNPNNVKNIDFGNPIDAAKKEVTELKADGAQVIIALAHIGTDKSSEFTSEMIAEQVEGINLIVDGHSHSTYEEGLAVKNTLIVSTGEYIKNIGVVLIDPSGKMDAGLVKAADFTSTDTAIDDIVKEYSTEQDKLLSEEIGYTTLELDGVREHVRAGETNFGDLVTDAFLDATGADIAITNGGGIRASIPAGEITKKDIVTVFPFGNFLVTKKVTGEAILKALELGVSAYPETLGAFLQVSGVTFTVDPSKPAGSRVSDVMIQGTAIDPKAEYLLATNDFMIAGGDGYTMLADFPVANEYGSMEDIVAEYIHDFGDIYIKNQKRITFLEVQEPEAATDETAGEADENDAAVGETDTSEGTTGETAGDTTDGTAQEETDMPDTGEAAPVLAFVLIGLASVSAAAGIMLKKKGNTRES